jgi:hypothetical protein
MLIPPEKIGFDFDGVIADIGEAFIRLACDDHNYCSLNLQEITDFHVEKCTDIPEFVVNRIFSDILEDSLAAGLIPLPGVLEVLQSISHSSTITIITARSAELPVADWFDHYLPSETCRKINIIAMHDHDQKVRYIEQENLDFFIDDRAETCAHIAKANLQPILFRQPWNSRWHDFTTVSSWQEIAGLIDS